jgi:lipoprotein-releasing system ATP-binding protein
LILEDVSLSLDRGASAAIMGPSGSGKSTLLNILGTLEPPDAGRVVIDGEEPLTMAEQPLARFRNRRIGFVFQEHHLMPQCSVLENVLLPTLAFPCERTEDDAVARAKALLDRVHLTNRLDHRPAELSGGERQRVAIARALINQPTLLLADEPTGNLDRAAAADIVALLEEIHRAEQTVLLVVTHSERVAARFDHRWELRDAKLAPA